MKKVKVAARTIIESICRDGGLTQLSFNNLSPQVGTRTHQTFYEYLNRHFSDFISCSEYSMDYFTRHKNIELQIQARADIILLPEIFTQNLTEYTYDNNPKHGSAFFSLKDDNITSSENYYKEEKINELLNEFKSLKDGEICEITDQFKINKVTVMEIKTVSLPLEDINKNGYSLHWLQAILYTAILYLANPALLLLTDFEIKEDDYPHSISAPKNSIYSFVKEESPLLFNKIFNKKDNKVSPKLSADAFLQNRNIIRHNFSDKMVPVFLAYVSQETLEAKILLRKIKMGKLIDFINALTYAYLDFAISTAQYQSIRNQSIIDMSFPYSSLRNGQKIFMNELLAAIKSKVPLLAELPTGTGKTIASLYPAIKAIPYGIGGKIFYLTAKASTREVAEKALRDLRAKGLFLRSICLRAKEQSCLAPELYCDHTLCPFASSYYKNLPKALKKLLACEELRPEILASVGKEFNLCPFELSLDISLFCDVIIGDYNHVLDPRVKLERFFNQVRDSHTLLFDEAHNLADRSRDMYSVDIQSKDLDELRIMINKQNPKVVLVLDQLRSFFDRLRILSLQNDLSTFLFDNEKNINRENIYEESGLFIMKDQSIMLNELMRSFLKEARFLFDNNLEVETRRKLLDVFSALRYYLRIVDEFWSDRYIFAFRANERSYHHKLICLDPSKYIVRSFYPNHSAIFFSATLSPFSYYGKIICEDDTLANTLSLNSPFPKENLKVFIYPNIKTTYQERDSYIDKVARVLAFAATRVKGHQLFFFPSFAYMSKVEEKLIKYIPKDIKIIKQVPSMNHNLRENFIEQFKNIDDSNKNLIGLAVLGGIFSEGIDLIGPRLDGVSIVGVGIPQVSAERNMMAAYYEEKFGEGFFYAYQFPGFNRVLQAAGRLIRSAEDLGFLLLIDERYTEERYKILFPNQWDIELCQSEFELCEKLENCKDFIDESRLYMNEIGINYRFDDINGKNKQNNNSESNETCIDDKC